MNGVKKINLKKLVMNVVCRRSMDEYIIINEFNIGDN